MCGRCSGLHGAVALARARPDARWCESHPAEARGWDAALIVFGMIGLAIGAFEWSATSVVRRSAHGAREPRSRSRSGVAARRQRAVVAADALSRRARRLHLARRRIDRRLDRRHGAGPRRLHYGLPGARIIARARNSTPRLRPELRADAARRHRAFLGLSALTVGLAKGEGVQVHAIGRCCAARCSAWALPGACG